MTNEKGNFRSSLFGGFNRRDVADYIEKLSAERNKYKAKSESLEDKIEKMQDDIDLLTKQLAETVTQLDEARQEPLDLQLTAFEDAVAAVTDFRDIFSGAAAEIGALSISTNDNLSQLNAYLESIPITADETGAKINTIIDRLNQLKNEI